MAHELGCNIAIEDDPEWAREIANNGIRTLLLEQPWNLAVAHDKIVRVKNWQDITAYCQDGCLKR